MRRWLIFVFISVVAASTFAGNWRNGLYFAQEDQFSANGWKYNVTLEVNNGRIVSAIWNGTNINGGADMISNTDNQSDWHAQAEKAQKSLLRTQDPTRSSGVSKDVAEFFTLAEKALAADPVPRGPYRDGYFQAENAEFSAKSGWKDFATFTVVNGTVVQVNWNGIHKDGGDTKKIVSANGGYPMVTRGGAQSEWYVQAALVEDYFLNTAGRAPRFTDGYHTDAIAGASIGVSPLYKLAKEALTRR